MASTEQILDSNNNEIMKESIQDVKYAQSSAESTPNKEVRDEKSPVPIGSDDSESLNVTPAKDDRSGNHPVRRSPFKFGNVRAESIANEEDAQKVAAMAVAAAENKTETTQPLENKPAAAPQSKPRMPPQVQPNQMNQIPPQLFQQLQQPQQQMVPR